MKYRSVGVLAWTLCGVALAAAVGQLVLLSLTWSESIPERWGIRGYQTIVAFFFSLVGALIASRRPGNALGWMLLSTGVIFGIQGLGDEYSLYALKASSGPLLGADVAAWLGEWVWVPAIGFMATFIPLLFPDGHLSSRRWRPVAWVAGAGIAISSVAWLLQPGPLVATPQLDNPFGIGDASLGDRFDGVGNGGLVLLMAATVAAAAGLVMRFRRSTGDERQQLKWFAFAAVVFAIGLLLAGVGVTDLGVVLAAPGIPIAMATAVLRYRLYDIDLVINRTLVYGLLTALLVAVYVVVAVGLGAAVRSVAGQESNAIVIAASTLAVAGLFGPARRRIQAFIDRRFYRRKYDAARTLEFFSARLREQVDLDSLAGELVGVVRDTMQPTHVSLWLRSIEEAR